MNAKFSVFVICLEMIIYLLLYILHDCTFNFCKSPKLAHYLNNNAKYMKKINNKNEVHLSANLPVCTT